MHGYSLPGFELCGILFKEKGMPYRVVLEISDGRSYSMRQDAQSGVFKNSLLLRHFIPCLSPHWAHSRVVRDQQTTIPEIVRKIQAPQLFYEPSSYPHSQVISAARATYSKVIQVISANPSLHG